MVEISASLLNVDPENSIKTFYDLEVAHTNYFHIDVMDGKFVEGDTESIMIKYAEYIKHISQVPLDVHLMVQDVKKYVNDYLSLEPNTITFQMEALKDKKEILDLINYIKTNGCKAGLAIKPKTKLEEIYEYLPYLHQVLIMTVEPGKGGQELIESTILKVKDLKDYIDKNNIDIDIEVDGGINTKNVESLKQAGANIIVAGTSIIKSDDYRKIIRELKK